MKLLTYLGLLYTCYVCHAINSDDEKDKPKNKLGLSEEDLDGLTKEELDEKFKKLRVGARAKERKKIPVEFQEPQDVPKRRVSEPVDIPEPKDGSGRHHRRPRPVTTYEFSEPSSTSTDDESPSELRESIPKNLEPRRHSTPNHPFEYARARFFKLRGHKPKTPRDKSPHPTPPPPPSRPLGSCAACERRSRQYHYGSDHGEGSSPDDHTRRRDSHAPVVIDISLETKDKENAPHTLFTTCDEKPKDICHLYSPLEGYMYSEVRHNGEIIWKCSGDTRIVEVILCGIGKPDKTLVMLTNGGDRMVFKKIKGTWIKGG